MSRTSLRPRPAAFSLVELLVVVAVIALLISLLLPALSGVKAQGRLTLCANQVRQLVWAGFTYAHEHKGVLPDGGWRNQNGIGVYLRKGWNSVTPWIMACPEAPEWASGNSSDPYWGGTYVINMYTYTLHQFNPAKFRPVVLANVPSPAQKLFFADGVGWNTNVNDTNLADYVVRNRHFSEPTGDWHDFTGRTANIGYLDGHIDFKNKAWFNELTPAKRQELLRLPPVF